MGPSKPKPAPGGTLGALFDEYEADFERAKIRPEWLARVTAQHDQLVKNMDAYREVSDRIGNFAPEVVGLAHMMECNFNFQSHLHNGDPLTGKTFRVPKGRPFDGSAPFNWVESAVDALKWDADKASRIRKGYGVKELPEMLDYLERYNGLGSRRKGIKTPYLWSGTTLYSKGKYVKDHVWDENATSQQVGAAAVLKLLIY